MKKQRFLFYFIIVVFMFVFNFYFRPVSGNPLINDEYKNSSNYINNLYRSDEYFKTKLLSLDEYHIYDEIVQNSLNDSEEVTIECNKKCLDVFAKAYDAVYLDHPELINFLGISAYKSDGTKIIYNNYEKLGKVKSFLGTMRIEREIDIIRRETKDMTDKEKILYVYNYVASHNYDRLFMRVGVNQSIYSFFTKGSSVCAGFAKVSQILFQNVGINSYLALSSNHMWNYVEYEGKYYIFDATYGTTFYDSSSQYYNGLGETTTGVKESLYMKYYPKIETDTTLRKLFGV